MKQILLTLCLFITFNVSSQEKCVTVKVEKIEDYRVKITKTNTCKNVITISTMLEKEWKARKKKRKNRKKKS